jgi:hypothetical protein
LWWLFVALAAAAMVMALWEFYLLAKRLKLKPDPTAGYLAGAALITIATLTQRMIQAECLLVQFVIIALTAGALIAATLRGAPFDKMIASTARRSLACFTCRCSAVISFHCAQDSTSVCRAPAVVLLSCIDGRGCRRVLRRTHLRKTQTRAFDQSGQDVGRRGWRSRCRTRDGDARTFLVLSANCH